MSDNSDIRVLVAALLRARQDFEGYASLRGDPARTEAARAAIRRIDAALRVSDSSVS